MADIDTTPGAEITGFPQDALEGGTLPPAISSGGGGSPSGNASGGSDSTAAAKSSDPRQALKDGASKYGAEAADRIRTFADTGKAKAGGALDEFSTMLTDAAGQVDEKLGAQYGDYARQAAGFVSDFSESIKSKNVDDLLEDARGYVRKSPGVAIGVAAALGFVIARLAQSGIETGAQAASTPDQG